MTISPYTNHSNGQAIDSDPTASGPSAEYQDLEDESGIFKRGYTYVIVDLPGFGGSSGCTDWGGPSEQAAVKNAIEWAAAQPWSNGKVGTYGVSYDGWTGLMALAQQPKGLGAVVSMEPVYSGYRFEYTNGVRFVQSAIMGPEFDAYTFTPGTIHDTPQYEANGLPLAPHCLATNIALQQQDSESAGFWQVRNLIPAVKAVNTPLFLMQGFLETRTRPDGAWDLFNNLTGPKRGWFGQWDHTVGNDKWSTGREDWFPEVLRFYDRYLKGETPDVEDPAIEVQSGDGRWRSETRWPPLDSSLFTTTLRTGTYADDDGNVGTGGNVAFGGNGNVHTTVGSPGNGIWTISAPLPYPVHLAGEPHVTVDVSAPLPNANLVVDVYDIDAGGRALLISRGAQLVRASGLQSFDLYGQDWPIPAGHRLGVLVTGSNNEWWVHVPTQQTVTVNFARASLPFLRFRRSSNLTGTGGGSLTAYKSSAPFTVSQATIDAAKTPFALPEPLEQPE